MNSTIIYTSQITRYNELNDSSNKSQLEQCIILADIKADLLAKYGTDKNRKYSDATRQVIASANIKKAQFNKDAQVGEYLKSNPDNQDLRKLQKTIIYRNYIAPPKKDIIKPPKPSIDVAYYKDCERKYFALMDYMGGKADSILEKALKAFNPTH